ncbi:cytochrome P460 family protein [Novosphingobium sp.]|uniref:cytochrome P460 family protein n=1 Tax=Novosphingobium sp. TaxID=1874826 RepID=UPI0025CD70E4|nr:cytochrome P460 family protein [Novosphingobium sp.]
MVGRFKSGLLVVGAVALAAAGAETLARSTAPPGAVAYTADGRAMLPANYRDWVFLTSGLDMTYAEPAAVVTSHMFDNVFVDPAALATFRRSGRWPEGTVLVKEAREGLTKGSINKAGQFQSEAVADVELHVKDTRRFGGWAFFKIVDGKPGAIIPKTASCYSCHDEHGAVDSTFVQFYPTLAGIARARGTLK